MLNVEIFDGLKSAILIELLFNYYSKRVSEWGGGVRVRVCGSEGGVCVCVCVCCVCVSVCAKGKIEELTQ